MDTAINGFSYLQTAAESQTGEVLAGRYPFMGMPEELISDGYLVDTEKDFGYYVGTYRITEKGLDLVSKMSPPLGEW